MNAFRVFRYPLFWNSGHLLAKVRTPLLGSLASTMWVMATLSSQPLEPSQQRTPGLISYTLQLRPKLSGGCPSMFFGWGGQKRWKTPSCINYTNLSHNWVGCGAWLRWYRKWFNAFLVNALYTFFGRDTRWVSFVGNLNGWMEWINNSWWID